MQADARKGSKVRELPLSGIRDRASSRTTIPVPESYHTPTLYVVICMYIKVIHL